MPSDTQRFAHIQRMNEIVSKGKGMDIIIISTPNLYQERFWQNRLHATRGKIIKQGARILAVHEDWSGGAGNGLGTLYALHKANQLSQERYDVDILEELDRGASIAVYHTAGKGTRLAPLPGSEMNNKSAVKLPGLISIEGKEVTLTLLEAVIKQTSIYALSRKGRISVFWGDQVFIPSVAIPSSPTHHADILCQLGKMPDEDQWKKEALHNYGLIAVDDQGNAKQVEKITFPEAQQLIQQNILNVDQGIGISLGAFSLSIELARALLQEFKLELLNRSGKFDTDPHFWMPMTLDEKTYLRILSPKSNHDELKDHYQRIQEFKHRFQEKNLCNHLLGAVDIGRESYWWDYGTIENFRKNTLKILERDDQGNAMRLFFGISEKQNRENNNFLHTDEKSILLNSYVHRGKINNSLLVNVRADYLDADHCVIIQVSGSEIFAEEALLYNVADGTKISCSPRSVRADCFPGEKEHYAMGSELGRHGGEDWYVRLPGNKLSYEELYHLNDTTSETETIDRATEEHEKIRLQAVNFSQ